VHLHEVPTRSNKVSPRTLQTGLVITRLFIHYGPYLLTLNWTNSVHLCMQIYSRTFEKWMNRCIL
jgi:hypothetical protein